ncbi:hypothetical protein PTKIN_Ptkin05aG0171900 [Pterospermum kingtungense]
MAHQEKKLKLYSFWRSSCSCRIRIALNLKGLEYQYIPVNLLKGEQFSPEFQKLNPVGFVPVLVDGDMLISDSFAICMYLEEKYPQHPLLPSDLQTRALTQLPGSKYRLLQHKTSSESSSIGSSLIEVASFMYSFQKYIEAKVSPDEKIPWAKFHIEKGFEAIEKLLKDHAGRYATGDEVFMADLFLAPQLHAGIKKFNVDMAKFPLLSRLYEAYNELPQFQNAMPEKQPDAPSA